MALWGDYTLAEPIHVVVATEVEGSTVVGALRYDQDGVGRGTDPQVLVEHPGRLLAWSLSGSRGPALRAVLTGKEGPVLVAWELGRDPLIAPLPDVGDADEWLLAGTVVAAQQGTTCRWARVREAHGGEAPWDLGYRGWAEAELPEGAEHLRVHEDGLDGIWLSWVEPGGLRSRCVDPGARACM